jgi:Flp pilus assembly pilin Flp
LHIAKTLDAFTGSQIQAMRPGGKTMMNLIRRMWSDNEGQDVAEYAIMLAVILVVVVGAVRLIGTNANTIFGNVNTELTK